jgi:endonuclease YncB( thermonuclease family)
VYPRRNPLITFQASILFLALLILPAILLAGPEYKWEKLEGCTLAKGWQDGDSFTVRIAPRKFRVFRLYFVDTPEDGADKRFPQRIQDQADYFGVSTDRVVQVGDEAAAFTRKLLEGKPFTVYTLWQDALGSSKRQRFYAMIEVEVDGEARWLSSMLVREGLARIYGKRIQLPCGTSSRDYLELLSALEGSAKRGGKGGWAK